MDHSEDDKRFYVYVHKNQDGDVVYVGSGTDRRWNRSCSRTAEHKAVFDSLTKEIVRNGMNKQESIAYELELYNKYYPTGKLFNKSKPTPVRITPYLLLNDHFYYDESSYSCLKIKVSNSLSKAGEDTGHISKGGYYSVNLKGVKYPAHRVIWAILNKQDIPSGLVIDHIDNNPKNNNISNLRLVTISQNNKNRVTNDEMTGISWHDNVKAWHIALGKDLKHYSKQFNTSVLFPDDDLEIAKEKCLLLAKEYRQLIEESKFGCERMTEIDNMVRSMSSISKSKKMCKHKEASPELYNIYYELNSKHRTNRWSVVWKEDGKQRKKTFTCNKLFPDLPPEEAKQKTLELAIEFKKQLNND